MKKDTGLSKIFTSTLALAMVAFVGIATSTHAEETDTLDGTAMYRLFNTFNGEHLYTSDYNEMITLNNGNTWNYEGIAWVAPKTGQAVYRLFHPYTGEHFYTRDENEKDILSSQYGWTYEGVAWHTDSETDENACKTPIYRLNNSNMPLIASHHYTLDEHERDVLVAEYGWSYEGVSWFSSHDVEVKNTSSANCKHDGYTGDTVCKLCGKTQAGTVIPRNDKHEHLKYYEPIYEWVHVVPNWQGGYVWKCYCNICGEVIAQTNDTSPGQTAKHMNYKHGYNYSLDMAGDNQILSDGLVHVEKMDSFDTYKAIQKEHWECQDCRKNSTDLIHWDYSY